MRPFCNWPRGRCGTAEVTGRQCEVQYPGLGLVFAEWWNSHGLFHALYEPGQRRGHFSSWSFGEFRKSLYRRANLGASNRFFGQFLDEENNQGRRAVSDGHLHRHFPLLLYRIIHMGQSLRNFEHLHSRPVLLSSRQAKNIPWIWTRASQRLGEHPIRQRDDYFHFDWRDSGGEDDRLDNNHRHGLVQNACFLGANDHR